MLSPIELFLTCVSTVLHGPTSDIREASGARRGRCRRSGEPRVRRRPRQPSLCRLLPPQTETRETRRQPNRLDRTN